MMPPRNRRVCRGQGQDEAVPLPGDLPAPLPIPRTRDAAREVFKQHLKQGKSTLGYRDTLDLLDAIGMAQMAASAPLLASGKQKEGVSEREFLNWWDWAREDGLLFGLSPSHSTDTSPQLVPQDSSLSRTTSQGSDLQEGSGSPTRTVAVRLFPPDTKPPTKRPSTATSPRRRAD
eukprot:Sspe_Gene.66845::Locus_39493_Transcript_1_1_Confidence_1.000_Length_953::g.66845::m.66845